MNRRKEVAVTVENLSHHFPGRSSRLVLSEVSFQVGQGEIFVILGPNGSGKSTLMRLLAGIDRPVSGHLLLSGQSLNQIPRKTRARVIAYVPQIFPESFAMTCRDLVMAGRAPRQGMLGFQSREDSRAVEEAMAFTDTLDFKARDFQTLSGGERQRVLLAAAIAQEPSIMLLDEPTSALDPGHQIRIMDLLFRLSREKGTTLVMVLHDISLAAMVADRILLLKDGRIVSQGKPAQALALDTLESVYECRFQESSRTSSNTLCFSTVSEYINNINR